MGSERAFKARATRAQAAERQGAENAALSRSRLNSNSLDELPSTTSEEFKAARRRSAHLKASSPPFVHQKVGSQLLPYAGCVSPSRAVCWTLQSHHVHLLSHPAPRRIC